MRIPELIELIQTHLPEELSPKQIAEIRANLADSPELQEALLTELSMEQSLATKYAPPPTNYDEVIARIGTLATTRKKKHWMIWSLAILSAIAVAVGIFLMLRLHRHRIESTPTIAKNSQPDQYTTTRATDRHVTTAPTTRLAARNPIQTKDPQSPVTDKPQTRPVEPVVANLPLTWRDYALPGSDEVSGWQSQLPKLFVRTGNAKEPKLSNDRKYVQFNGTYRLGLLPTRDRLLRLDIYSGKKCELEFWNGNNKVRIKIEPNKGISMESIARKDLKSAPAVVDSAQDHYLWRSYRFYGLDIRHQDGRIMVCRGEVPLASVAMPKPPVEGRLNCSDLKMYLAEARAVGRLVLPDRTVDPVSIHKTSASAFEWKIEPQDSKKEKVELLVDKSGGKVRLLNKVDHAQAKASFAVDVAPSAGVELTVHVTEFHPSTVIRMQSSMSGDYIRFEPHNDRHVLQNDRKKKEQAVARGETIGSEFWVRMRVGGDSWEMWISPDSRRWWRKQNGQSTNLPGRVEFSMEIPSAKDKGVRRTSIGEVTVRRFEAFARLADPKLVSKAEKALTPEILGFSSRSRILASLAGSADKNASRRDWLMACDTALIGRAVHWQVRCDALGELLAEATVRGKNTDPSKVLAAINELSEISWYTGNMGPIVHKALELLARNCLDTSRHEELERIVNASYHCPVGRHNSYVVAPNLLRFHLLSLISRGEWKSVRREAMRAMYHSKEMNSSRDKNILAFTQWALSQAHAHLAAKSNPKAVEVAAIWRHPLVVNDDREMLNILGEFLFLVQSKHYGPACKVITGRTLPDALVSLDEEEDLLQSSHFRIRELIRTTPELRDVLNHDYSEIGMIRLERARRQNDLTALKSIAVQFYGSAPGFGAMHVLADRDLSNGNFWGAAARYRLLGAEEGYKQRSDAVAKLRLAWAMLGKLVGEKVTKPVALPGGTFSPQEFEQMIERLADNRKAAPVTRTIGKVYVGPDPRGRSAKLTHLADIPGERISSSYALVARPAVFAVDAERLIIGFIDKLFAIDRKSRRVLWSHEPDSKQRSNRRRNRHGKTIAALASRPLQIDDNLYVCYGLQGRPLTCVDTKTGKFLWSKRYDDCVLSDPVLIGSWVSVITTSNDTSPRLQLHRVSPQTGESSLSSELVRIRDQWPTIGRPAVVGDSILFRAEGCLVNCDVRGAVRWARRLPFVPATALPDLHEDMVLDDIIMHDGNVIFSLPGCPYIMCVSAETAKTLWSFMIHSSAQLLGLHGGNVIVIESDTICALDPDTGKLRWQRRHPGRHAAVFPAARDTLVSVCLDKPLSTTKRKAGKDNVRHVNRYIRWISSRNGTTVKELPIEGDVSLYNVLQISSDGKRIFGLVGDSASRQHKIFMVEIAN